jgi:hypothetical protein
LRAHPGATSAALRPGVRRRRIRDGAGLEEAAIASRELRYFPRGPARTTCGGVSTLPPPRFAARRSATGVSFVVNRNIN